MSAENEQLVNTSAGADTKRHHSIENLRPSKQIKTDKTPQKTNDTKAKEVNNGNHEPQTNNEVLEKGDIVFTYKPKLGVDEASSIDDVQLFHVLLIPEQENNKNGTDDRSSKTRLIKIGKKKLPTQNEDRFWAFVEKSDDDMEKIEENPQAQSYETATVGPRTIKADRIAGKGKYIIAQHDERRTVIGYVLETPTEIGDVQNAFNIIKEASFTISVKNPQKKNPPAVGLTQAQKAEFPEEVQKKFGSYEWLPAEPAMLDIAGCEILLISSTMDDLAQNTTLDMYFHNIMFETGVWILKEHNLKIDRNLNLGETKQTSFLFIPTIPVLYKIKKEKQKFFQISLETSKNVYSFEYTSDEFKNNPRLFTDCFLALISKINQYRNRSVARQLTRIQNQDKVDSSVPKENTSSTCTNNHVLDSGRTSRRTFRSNKDDYTSQSNKPRTYTTTVHIVKETVGISELCNSPPNRSSARRTSTDEPLNLSLRK